MPAHPRKTPRSKERRQMWKVYDEHHCIDILGFLENMTEQEVVRSLVTHDNFPKNIVVKKHGEPI